MEETQTTQTEQEATSVNEGSQTQVAEGSNGLTADDLKHLSVFDAPKKAEATAEDKVATPEATKVESENKEAQTAEEKQEIDLREYNKAREQSRKLEKELKTYQDKVKEAEAALGFTKQLEAIPNLKDKLAELAKQALEPPAPTIDPEIEKKIAAIEELPVDDFYKDHLKGNLLVANEVQNMKAILSQVAQKMSILDQERARIEEASRAETEQKLEATYEVLDKTFEDMVKADGLVKGELTDEILESDETLNALSTLLFNKVLKAGFTAENPPPLEKLKEIYNAAKKTLKIEGVKQATHKIENLKKAPAYSDDKTKMAGSKPSRFSQEVEDDFAALSMFGR